MTKTCPECKSQSTGSTTRCHACYCQFAGASASPWKYRLASIAAGLTVAVFRYLIVN